MFPNMDKLAKQFSDGFSVAFGETKNAIQEIVAVLTRIAEVLEKLEGKLK